MRQPTSKRDAFAWYRAMVFGSEKPPIHLSEPQCGFYAVRAVKGGVLVPAMIWLQQEIDEHGQLADDEVLMCEVNGKLRDPHEVWDRLAAHAVPFAKYQHHSNLNNWAGWHQLDLPEADPTKPIDWERIEPPVFEV